MKKIFESFKETIIKEAKKLDLKNIYIATANISGDMGTMKKNEIYIKSKSSEGKDYVFLNLANPNYEYYEDVHINDFKKYFRQIDPEKDIKEMKLLSKWDLVDFGEEFWVTYISGGGKLGYKEKLENSLKLKEGKFTFSKQFADSPKQAIAKTDGKSGRVDELVRDKVWVAKEYADSMFVVTKEDPRNLGADKIFGYVKKSGLIDKYLKESFENLNEGRGSDITIKQDAKRKQPATILYFNTDKAKKFYKENYDKYGWLETPVEIDKGAWIIAYPDADDSTLKSIENFINKKVRLSYEIVRIS